MEPLPFLDSLVINHPFIAPPESKLLATELAEVVSFYYSLGNETQPMGCISCGAQGFLEETSGKFSNGENLQILHDGPSLVVCS